MFRRAKYWQMNIADLGQLLSSYLVNLSWEKGDLNSRKDGTSLLKARHNKDCIHKRDYVCNGLSYL